MILRDRRNTSHDLASLSRGGAVPMRDGMEKSQKTLARGCQLSAQLYIFQNCFVFDAVKLKN